MSSLNLDDLFSVNSLIFVITGAGSGLGSSMALALAQNNAAKVFILGRRPEALERTAKKAEKAGVIIPIQCDVASKPSLLAAAEEIARQTPFVNAVIANAGIIGPAELWALPEDQNRELYDTNVHAVFNTFVAFLSLLDAGNTHASSRGRKDFIQSQFISIASMAAFSRTEAVSHLYGAGKAAVVALTKKLSSGFASKGIRANCIAPGLYITEATEFASGGEDWSEPGSIPMEEHVMTRSGSPEDIAGAILFLTSRAGAYVNGNVLLSDGGAFGQGPLMY